MSWQATAWAASKLTGSAGTKLTLLALANYADSNGICWPTQETLATDTEQSIDTVQRQIKRLVALELVRVEKREANRGQWTGKIYYLNMGVAEKTEPQSAARSQPLQNTAPKPPPAADRTAPATATMPHQARSPYRTAVRYKPSIEHPIEPPVLNIARASAAERLEAFRGKRDGDEVVQNRIAQRLGSEGWLILGALSDASRAKLTNLERRGDLDEATLHTAVLNARCMRPP